MTREEIIDGLEIYTVGRLKKNRVHITVEKLQKFIDAIEALDREESVVKVLEEVKAEIERRGGNDEKAFCKSLNSSYKLGLRESIEIIDRKIAEVTKNE